MTELQKYRSRQRRILLRVFVAAYLLIVTPMLYQYFRTSRLSADNQLILAHVTHSKPAGPNSRGSSTYEFAVDGRSYSGSAGLELPVGSELKVYFSPGSPSNNSVAEPGQEKRSRGAAILLVTPCYGLMVILVLALVSIASPPPGITPAEPEDVGISRN